MGKLTEQLDNHTRIGLDTSIFIYHLEEHPRYRSLTQELLSGIEAGRWMALVSILALMELTVRPWQLRQPDVVRTYEEALAHFPNAILMDVTRDVARQAAQIRAQYNLRPADALHVATALAHDATAFVTNDGDFTRVEEIEILILRDFAN